MDNFNRIARTNVYIIFGKLLDKLIKTNDDGEVILCKAGLSELVEEYSFCNVRLDGVNYSLGTECAVGSDGVGISA